MSIRRKEREREVFSKIRDQIIYNPENGRVYWLVKDCSFNAIGKELATMRKGYKNFAYDGSFFAVHRLVYWLHTGELPDYVDHKNCIRDDNRFTNLRKASAMQNSHNRKGISSCGYKGVSRIANRGMFRAQIKIDGKNVYLGCAKTPEKAHELYKVAAARHFGEFACLDMA